MDLLQFVRESLAEDTGTGDHTSLACIPAAAKGKARLLVKDDGIISGLRVAAVIAEESNLSFYQLLKDGDDVKKGDIAFTIEGSTREILRTERLLLNCMQRMSGISTVTRRYVNAVKGTRARVLDTRKTTPLMRALEKEAVRLGGGLNHRMGLYDMVMIKDNHVDAAGGIRQALESTRDYLKQQKLSIPVEIETRNLKEVEEALATGMADRIMLDNFSPALLKEAIVLINRKAETEASGGITLENIRDYAETGVDFISVGALTHSVKSLDLSLKIF
jgi:nicotinate-nucleotide pyrophosphorylase (carboxylating)